MHSFFWLYLTINAPNFRLIVLDRNTYHVISDFVFSLDLCILSDYLFLFFTLQQEKETMKEELVKEKEEAVAERNKYWQDVISEKEKQHQDALSNKVNKYGLPMKALLQQIIPDVT